MSRLLLTCLSVALAGLFAAACAGSSTANAQADRPAASTRPEVIAWVPPYDDALASLARSARFLTIASPTYFRLAVDGLTVRVEDWDPAQPFPRQRLPAALQGSSAAVLPLVGCIGPCGPKISRVLDDEGARQHHIDALTALTREQRLGGLVIDYEDVDARSVSVDRFIHGLAANLHAASKRLVLVVQEPCGADPACKRAPYPFDLKSVAREVDLLVIMEYDYVVDGTGPPAPRAWVDRGLAKVIAEVGPSQVHKIICALPLYGRLTQGIAPDTAVLFDDVSSGRLRKRNVTIGPLTLDPETLSKVATVTTGTRSGTLYLEDRETFALRVARIAPLGLGGVALWRLGGEDPCIAPELAKLRGLPPPACR